MSFVFPLVLTQHQLLNYCSLACIKNPVYGLMVRCLLGVDKIRITRLPWLLVFPPGFNGAGNLGLTSNMLARLAYW